MGAVDSSVILETDYTDRYRIVSITDEATFDKAWKEFMGISFRINFGYSARHEDGAIILSTNREMPEGPVYVLRKVAAIYFL